MSGGFFGFDSALPERRDQQPLAQQQQQGKAAFGGFASNNFDAFDLGGKDDDDIPEFHWGQGNGQSLLEGGDDLNDETFGADANDISNNFQFSSQPVQQSYQSKPRGPIASTQSRYKPRAAADPFAASEDDFYSSRPAAKKTSKAPAPKARPAQNVPSSSVENLWQQNQAPSPAPAPQHQQQQMQQPMWGAASSSVTKPFAPPPGRAASSAPPPPGQIKSLEEIEAEMSRVNVSEPPAGPRVLSLEEVEQQMMSGPPADLAPPAQYQQQREPTPVQPGLAGSGYASGQALLDSMFPELGSAPAGPTGSFTDPNAPASQQQPPQISPQEMDRLRGLHERISAKISGMSKYNNLMGSSDKDFITRIQLSQLATADPYTSDFYAQVYSALQRSRMAPEEGPTVVKISAGFGFGVGGPTGNRFGKMGSATMQKLSTQVKKLVENRQQHQKSMGNAALQGALGRVTRGNAAAPRPVLAVPTAPKSENRPVAALNQESGIRRQALTKKQVMLALEGLYDAVLELEQARREMPPPTAMEEIERWNAACEAKVQGIWRKLMVMEPLDVSTPHPFISLVNPTKGQRLFPRLLRHLPHQQTIVLLTLLIATFSQLGVARAPPPPAADASLLSKADKLDRARREAETDNFLHDVIPGMDIIINRCNLGLIAGLLGICTQRMEVWRVASTRPGVALFTALLTRAQSNIRAPPQDPQNPSPTPAPDAAELDQWNKTYAYFLHVLLPHLNEFFPSSAVQKAAFGPSAYLMAGDVEKEGVEMERREAEVWGLAAALAVNAPEEQQTNLVGALRDKILQTVQAARSPSTPPPKAEIKLRNVNMFLNGLGLDASMIE